MYSLVIILCVSTAAYAAQDYRTTPVPILKQINRQNDDGSYSYGYEAADGTFKIETKYPSGEVYGKYGYIGDDGKVREIEYGATRRGFEPAGTGINVPPPTLTNPQSDSNSLDYDDGQYREDPSVYYQYKSVPKNKKKLASVPTQASALPTYYNNPAPPTYYNTPAPPTHYNLPATASRSYNSPPTYNNPVYSSFPATNVNLQTGSYSLSYSG